MTQKVVNSTTADCPFCPGKITMGDDADTGNGVLFHTMPMCERFEVEDPETFVKSALAVWNNVS